MVAYNKEKKVAYAKQWRLDNPDRHKGHRLKKYGLTFEQYMGMVADQGGACAICKIVLDMGKHTHVDHCHDTGKVRGILCNNCNRAVGVVKENPTIAKNLATYIRERCK